MNNQIIQSCIAGDREAFRELVNQYADFAFSITFRILNEEEEARDLVQESFITVWEKIGTFRVEMNFRNWFYRIMVNKCFDALRKRNRAPRILTGKQIDTLPGFSAIEDPDRKMDNKELGSIIRQLTNSLSPAQKVVFTLCDLEGLSHEEIAEITGMFKTSVKSNLNLARKKIREMIKKYL